MSQVNGEWMRQVVRRSIDNATSGTGGPFAAMVVKNGAPVALEANEVMGRNDPTAHAEVMAIRVACEVLGTYDLSGCEMYSSAEPCPMCLAAIYWAHIDRVYYANTKEDAAAVGFDDAEIYRELAKPSSERRIALQCCRHDEALEAFRLWEQFEGKVPY